MSQQPRRGIPQTWNPSLGRRRSGVIPQRWRSRRIGRSDRSRSGPLFQLADASDDKSNTEKQSDKLARSIETA
jgi:hypothetical protein